jgi:hypothetical protein
MAWRWPPVVTKLAPSEPITSPEGSTVAWAQNRLLDATQMALAAVAKDVRLGLLETVGVFAEWDEKGERASVVIRLAKDIDTEFIAKAIDLENVEAWCDEQGQVHAGIGPWYTTKDVDQVVLAITKVLHVLLGLHAKPR